MSGILVFGVKSIGLSKCGKNPPSTLLIAARHNKREIQAELGASQHIDPTRTYLNESLAGPAKAAEISELAVAKMVAAGVNVSGLRNDYAQAVELMFSLPQEFAGDDGEVFRACVDWTGRRFGVDRILSADIHRDEPSPHLHVLLLPSIEGGKMRGSDAVALARSAQARQSLGREVAHKFGLTMGAGKLAGMLRHQAALMALERMKDIERAAGSALWRVIKAAVLRDPGPYLDAQGIEAPTKELRDFTEIMISPGRGPRKERDTESPLGFAGDRLPRRTGDGKSPLGFAAGAGGRMPHQSGKGESPLGFGGASDTEKPDAQKAKPNLCLGFAAKPEHPGVLRGDLHGGAEHGDADTKGVHPQANDGTGGDQPGDWVRVRDGDEGPGDDHDQDDRGESGHAGPIRVKPDAEAGAPAGHEIDGDDVERLRDAELPAGYWDADAGEFAAPAGRGRPVRGGASP